jgi:hypothetical protein
MLDKTNIYIKMRNQKKLFKIALPVIAVAAITVFVSFTYKQVPISSRKLSSQGWTEVRDIYGPTFVTLDRDNVTDCIGCPESEKCYQVGNMPWCFAKTILTVRAPNSKWVFEGRPWVELVEDNQGAWEWNNIQGEPSRSRLILDNPHEKQLSILTASRPIKVRLVCKARYYPKGYANNKSSEAVKDYEPTIPTKPVRSHDHGRN